LESCARINRKEGFAPPHFAYVKSKPFEDDFCVDDESAPAEFEARVTCFFQDQDAGGEMRSDPLEMQRGGESAGASADDDYVARLLAAILSIL
jgi:hypothetical protein